MGAEAETKQFQKGSEYDVSNGPISKRSCTDILFLLIFIAHWVGLWVLAIYAYTKGDPMRITRVYDADGRPCGGSGDAANYPYLYWPNPSASLNQAVCVKTCPTGYLYTLTNNNNCLDTTSPAISCFTSSLTTYPTKQTFDRLCLPDTVKMYGNDSKLAAADAILNSMGDEALSQFIGDVKNSWEVVIIIACIALGIGAFYLLFLRYCAGVVAWFSILGTIAALAILGAMCHLRIKDANDNGTKLTTQSKNALNGVGIALYVLAGVMLLIVLIMFKRIRIAIAIMKTAAVFVKDCWSVIFIPPVLFIITAALYVWWIITALYIYSAGEVKKSTTSVFASVELNRNLQYGFLYHLFGLLWNNAFLIALNQLIVAGAACIWYFAPVVEGGQRDTSGAVRKSVWRAFRYHLGSLAFGSFIIAVVQFIRIILSYIQKKLDKDKSGTSKILKVVLCCVQCCLACFERCLKFLNKNAYIQIALTGRKFCSAAKDAFFLILRNFARFAAVAAIGDIFRFIGKAVISLGATCIGYIILTRVEKYQENLTSPIFPAVIGFFVAFVIADSFMSVYSLGADAILQCFACDEEMNHGSSVNTPETLRAFMDKHAPDRK
eukprot:GILI01001290.1.p1 GENE.GILI01001290.1~~GILI01001290.1.p1  ORF type:complete len:606 (+),score=184.83 GILI01001290.1:72-1889(+)